MKFESQGEALRALREKHHLSQTNFGKLVGIDSGIISKVENHWRCLTQEQVLKIMKKFDINWEDIDPKYEVCEPGEDKHNHYRDFHILSEKEYRTDYERWKQIRKRPEAKEPIDYWKYTKLINRNKGEQNGLSN